MLYHLLNMFGFILEFVTSLHAQNDDEEGDSLLTGFQIQALTNIIVHLLAYFSLYMLSGSFDELIDLKTKKGMFESISVGAAALQVSLLIQMIKNYSLRKQIAEAKGDASGSGFLGATGLTTVFNALTQTTTTLCANGQCFTIYSNTISSNLAAFGVSVTGINTYLIPLCCCLLTYSIWSVYKTKRSLTYKPFIMSVVGAVLIVVDNFILGDTLKLHNIPSWIGNGLLIGAALWSGRDSAKDQAPPFGF